MECISSRTFRSADLVIPPMIVVLRNDIISGRVKMVVQDLGWQPDGKVDQQWWFQDWRTVYAPQRQRLRLWRSSSSVHEVLLRDASPSHLATMVAGIHVYSNLI
jgi:hypothetical protein